MEAQGDTYAACASEMAAAWTHLFRHGGGCFDASAATQRRARWRCADRGPGADGDAHEAAALPCGSAPDAWLDWRTSDSFRSACPTEICAASDASLDMQQSPDGTSNQRAWCEEEAGSEDGAAAWCPTLDADCQSNKAELAAARAVWLTAASADVLQGSALARRSPPGQQHMSPCPNMRATLSACAPAASIAGLQEHAHTKRAPDGSPDDGQRDAAPTTRKPANANAPGSKGSGPVAVRPAPLSHFEDFFGWRTTGQSQAAGRRGEPEEAASPDGSATTPRVRCIRHPLLEAELPYDALTDARLQAVLIMLTSPPCAEPGACAHVAAHQVGQAKSSLPGPSKPPPIGPRHVVGLDRVEDDDSRSPSPVLIALPSWV